MDYLLFEDNDTLFIDKDTEIKDECPCRIRGDKSVIRFTGNPGVFLELYSTDGKQPCIGYHTNTNLSYGRFELCWSQVEKIIVDGINIVCYPNSENPNFALGTYGLSYVPKIECINGGSIQCPELTGTRVMTDDIQTYEGSTKCTGAAIYHILKGGLTKFDVMTQEQKNLASDITLIKPEFRELIDCEFPTIGLKRLLDVLKVAPSRVKDPAPWKEPGNSTYYMTLRSCVVLDLPIDMASSTEYRFENDKINYFLNKAYAEGSEDNDSFDITLAFAMYIFAMLYKNRIVRTPFIWEVAYEMIPTYCYNFKNDKSHAWNAAAFIEQNLSEDFKSSYTMFALKDADIRQTLMQYVNDNPHGIDLFDFFGIER